MTCYGFHVTAGLAPEPEARLALVRAHSCEEDEEEDFHTPRAEGHDRMREAGGV